MLTIRLWASCLTFLKTNLTFFSDKYLSMKKDADWSERITLFFIGCWCNYISKTWWSELSLLINHQLKDQIGYHNISLAEIYSLIFCKENTSLFLTTSHFFIMHLTIFDGPHLFWHVIKCGPMVNAPTGAYFHTKNY